MKKLFISTLVIVITMFMVSGCVTTSGGDVETKISLIPNPNDIKPGDGNYVFNHFKVEYDKSNTELAEITEYFTRKVSVPTSYEVKEGSGGNIKLSLTPDAGVGAEWYKLSVNKSGAVITAEQPAGVFYGLQTLLQLMPKEIKSKEAVSGVAWRVPYVEVVDSPRFPWRGLMLDVSRHWFTKEEVMAYIDQLAEYKMNRFHWHLTDDQGWRVQIDALPRLTEVGAWRAPRVGNWWTREVQRPGEKATYGGFYTKEDIAEVVEYARRRYVTVVPEIDVPGHSLAALVAYPELACFKAPETINVGNKFYGIDENSLCVGNPVTMEYMDKIFSEIAEMFPYEYIHIGGDECWKGFWNKCPKCQALKKQKGLADANELQSYFIRELEQLLKSKGKKLIGWDEIHEGGLAPDATVMSWRGMQGGIDAAKQGHHVIMTPNNHCYLDLYQGEPTVEPDTYSMCRLSDSYAFEPIPEGVSPELILGGQGNLWTESVPHFRHAEYMTWPRGWALAEVLWTDAGKKDWNDFYGRVEDHFRRADMADINYARSMYNAIVKTELDKDENMIITLSTELPDLDIYYTFDGTIPDTHQKKYTEPLRIPLNATIISINTYRGDEQVGSLIKLDMQELRKRVPRRRRVGNL